MLRYSALRGRIGRRARCYEVRVSAGEDPSTGERIVLADGVEIEGQGEAERAAYREAEKLRTKLLAEADGFKVARTKATVGALVGGCGAHRPTVWGRMTTAR